MKSEEQHLLQARCQHCHRQFTFNVSDNRLTAPCPFCAKLTKLELASAVQPERKQLPQWVLPAASLLSVTVIVTGLFYGLLNYYVPLELIHGLPRLHLIGYCFLMSASGVLTIAFAIYIFNWLREMRPIIKQIEVNTRRSGATEHRSPSVEATSTSESAGSRRPKCNSTARHS